MKKLLVVLLVVGYIATALVLRHSYLGHMIDGPKAQWAEREMRSDLNAVCAVVKEDKRSLVSLQLGAQYMQWVHGRHTVSEWQKIINKYSKES